MDCNATELYNGRLDNLKLAKNAKIVVTPLRVCVAKTK